MTKMTISGKHTHTAENTHIKTEKTEKKRKKFSGILDEIRRKNEIRIRHEIS